MTTIAKTDVRTARQRAGRIRDGIHTYLETLALIQLAWQERDWETLGYDDWDSYVETEFSEARLRLPAEHRQKAVVELRLAGMSQRAIGSALGVSQKTVDRDLDSSESNDSHALPDRVTSLDGRERPASRPAPAAVLVAPREPVGDDPNAERERAVASRPAVELPASLVQPVDPGVRERFERERRELEDRELYSRKVAECVWLLGEYAGRVDAAKWTVEQWEPSQDVYPKKTTRDRLTAAAEFLRALAEVWPA